MRYQGEEVGERGGLGGRGQREKRNWDNCNRINDSKRRRVNGLNYSTSSPEEGLVCFPLDIR